MADREDVNNKNQLEDIVKDFDQHLNEAGDDGNTVKTDSNESEGDDDDRLSKEEIAEKFDVEFAKASPNTSTQHLVRSGEDDAVCRTNLPSDTKRAETPGPFGPICERCRKQIKGDTVVRAPAGTYHDLHSWLADEIEDVQEPQRKNDTLKKSDAAAIIEYIEQLKEQIDQDSQ